MHVRRWCYLLQPARTCTHTHTHISIYTYVCYECSEYIGTSGVYIYIVVGSNIILYNNSSRMRVVSLTSGDSDSCEHLRKHIAAHIIIYIMSAYPYTHYWYIQRPCGRRLQESCPFWIDQKKNTSCTSSVWTIYRRLWPQSDLLIRILHVIL